MIDPFLGFSTYLGGTEHDGHSGGPPAVDSQGNVYVAGYTDSLDFPTTPGAFQEELTSQSPYPQGDLFVTKLDPTGSFLVFSTYLGGAAEDTPHSIQVDASGDVFVAGGTQSADFPTTPGAFDRTHGGGKDGFIAKLDWSGSTLIYSTYLDGSSGTDSYPLRIAVDAAGNVHASGFTYSADFPTTPGAYDRTYNGGQDGFVTKLNAAGSALVYSTFLGSAGHDNARDVAVDASGNAFLCGQTSGSKFPTTRGAWDTRLGGAQDAFVAKLNPSGSALVYSTFLGGAGSETCTDVELDSTGQAFVSGTTPSTDFPTTTGAYDRTYNGGIDLYVTRLNAAGSGLVYSTFLGGSSSEDFNPEGKGLALDASGAAYVSASTRSTDFPTTADALDQTHNGLDDVVIAKLNPTGSSLVYATYVGGGGTDWPFGCRYHATTSSLYVFGTSYSSDFPTTPGAFQEEHKGATSGNPADAFVLRLDF